MKASVKTTTDAIRRCLQAKLPIMVSGSPGIGKSAIFKQISDKYKLKLIDLRISTMDPVDFTGFPKITDNLATWVPFDVFPYETTPVPDGYNGWLIFLDELNSAVPANQKAAYRLLLDREIGQHKLHPKAFVVAAGNLLSDNAIVHEMGTALQSRLVHIELEVPASEWLIWAATNDIDHRVLAYINKQPQNLHKFDPDHADKTFPCPRTWEMCSTLIKDEPNNKLIDLETLIAGTIGEGMANNFVVHAEIYSQLPDYTDILKNPLTVACSDDPGVLYALSYMLSAQVTKQELPTIIKYIERMPIEFQTITLQDICRKNPAWEALPAINDWAAKNCALFV